ncbi:MAG: transporter [Planctomycetaceae bacterium]|nr:transporter [Planctomycetaceae bacterium]
MLALRCFDAASLISRSTASAIVALTLVGHLLEPAAEAQNVRGCRQCCPPGTSPSGSSMSPNGSTAPDGSTSPDGTNGSQSTDPNAANDPNNRMLNPNDVFNDPSATDAQAGGATRIAANPGSIGDFFGSVAVPTRYIGGAGVIGTVGRGATAPGPYSPLGGRQKLVEHDNPLPRDRAFINYSYFKDVPLTDDGVHVNRTTFGVEKTFLDGMMSFQVRVPTVSTLNSDVQNNGPPDNRMSSDTDYQLGNVNLAAKLLVYQTDGFAMSVGTGVTLPTADDINLYGNLGSVALRYENQSVHVLPFIGFVMTPTDRCFSQLLVQADFDTNGNSAYATNAIGTMENIGRFQDATFLYASWTTGYWLIKEMCCGQIQHGLAPMFEVHYNRSLRQADTASGILAGGGEFGIGEPNPGDVGGSVLGDFEAVNLTFGMHAQCSANCSLTFGYCVPAGGLSREDQFNGEARVLFNYFFGR